MADLSADLDDMKTETPAERAHKAAAKHRGQCLADVCHALLGIIETDLTAFVKYMEAQK